MNVLRKVVLFILILVSGFDIKAGGFKCVNYLIEFTLTNDTIIKGYYLTGNYRELFHFQEETFKDYLRNYTKYGTYSITIYTKIEILDYPSVYSFDTDSCDFKLSCAYPDNVIELKIDKIKSVKLKGISPCAVCDIDNKEEGYYWNGIMPEIITELTAEEIELLKETKPISECEFNFAERFSACCVLNYNSSIDEVDFTRLCESIEKRLMTEPYTQIKADVRNKGIIMIRLDFQD